jgi:hypothetical protein
MRYRFLKEIYAENKNGETELFQAGREIDETDVPRGTLDSLKWTKAIAQITDPVKAPASGGPKPKT